MGDGKNPLIDCIPFITMAFDSFAQDEFSKCFERTQKQRKPELLTISDYVDLFWRYFIIFPFRFARFLCASLAFFAVLPSAYGLNIAWLKKELFYGYSKAWTRAFGAEIKYHGRKPVVDEPHIFVSNHTSIIDYFVLSSFGFAHATIAQQHKGLMGWLQKHVLTLNGSLMFQRSDKSDRTKLYEKMKNHVYSHVGDCPLLVFPEGTCVNNEYTVLFHKGAFALDAVVCPVAIRYNKEFCDPYWVSSKQSFIQHIFYLMSSYKLKADVWWLPPMRRGKSETPERFADRVKTVISVQAGLRCVSWDGYMKNFFTEEKKIRMRNAQQSHVATGLKKRLSSSSKYIEGFSSSFPSKFRVKLTSQQLVAIKNQILVDLESNLWTRDDITELKDKQDKLISTWKKNTRLKDEEGGGLVAARRLENSSWRLWYKEQLMKRQEILSTPTTPTIISSF